MRRYVKLFSVLFFCSVLALGFTSCSDDDGYSLDKYWESLVTVNKIGDNTYDFTLDNGERLWVAAPVGLSLNPKYDRAIINYTILSDNFQGYDHAVKLNGYYDVLTKNSIYIASDDKVKQDSIGYDPIRVHAMWESGGYLNIHFGINTDGTVSHMLNLVSADPDKEIGKNAVKLEFRHNKKNDPEHYPANGYVSFDLTPYKAAGPSKVTFEITWTDFDGEKKAKTIEYIFDEAGSRPAGVILTKNEDTTNLNIY
ncbi:MAG: NigD-like protein [Prevotella sp.]|jgi:hypothetical protein|nr:NigD-like protein [Prevotella sp.]